MKIFLCSNNLEVWFAISKGYLAPKVEGTNIDKNLKALDRNERNACSYNCKAINSFMCALSPNEYNKISDFDTAKEIWEKLEIIYEGNSQVKDSEISMLVYNYELFKMHVYESISQMFTRFTNITNERNSYGNVFPSKEMVTKILRSLPSKREAKVTAINKLSFTLAHIIIFLFLHLILSKSKKCI